MAERVVLVRHGETDWSSTRRHTGRSDIPLNEEGRRLAASLQPVLAGITGIGTAVVLTSPLRRARDTCALAGFGDRAVVEPDLVEWDYGAAEGRRTAEIRVEVPGWSVWTHDPVDGETVDEVAARADRVLARIHDTPGVVLAVAHAHILRVLTARWCGLDPRVGRMFMLDPASVSILGHERETRCIERWNLVTTSDLERFMEDLQPARRRHEDAQRALGPEANGPS
jgi:broad specificity phosphatase PhoE